MRANSFGNHTAVAVVAVAIILMGGLIGLRVHTARLSDQQVALREEALIANGMLGWVQEVEGRVVGQTSWDEAVQNLGARYSPAWASQNIGLFLHDIGGFRNAYVVNASDRPIYASAEGSDRPVATYAGVASIATPLLARVRSRETQRLRSAGPAASPPPAIQASAFGVADGRPAIVTVTLVQSDFGAARLPGRAPAVVTVSALDDRFLDRFSDRFMLTNLHVHTGEAVRTPQPDQASTELRDASGGLVARLDWSPQTPSGKLLWRTLPGVIGGMLVFCVIAATLFLRGRNAARALVDSEGQAKFMAYHDHLTGLPNRAMFSERMAQALAEMRRSGRPLGVMALDLDRFKVVNDTYGHGAGDELIVDIAARLKALVRSSDIVVRLGGDEFAILYAGATPGGLAILGRRIIATLSSPIDLPVGRVFTGVSIGVTLVRDPDIDAGEALRQADLALYRAKDAGRGCLQFYEPEMDLALKARQAMEDDLRAALRADALTMVYQPQVDGAGQVVGVEALVRWTDLRRGAVPPTFFVAVAEERGLMEALGEFTLRRAFTDSLRWPGLNVAVNVSAIQLRSGAFLQLVAALIRETGADPHRIELEITEGVLLEDDENTHRTLNRLRAMGFSFALDDFGTGYSSLAYLRRYPVDKIKIDRSFITNLGVEKEAEAVVGAIIKLARALSLGVIAEGVETQLQRDSLRRAGCTHVQGYLFSPPVVADEVEASVANLQRCGTAAVA